MAKTVTGKDWTHSIFFYQNVDDKEIQPIIISDKNLIQEMSRQVDVDEKILRVYTYKSALSTFQLTKAILFHQFVVFETECWWWSIEKDGQAIVIQRSKFRKAVQDKNMHKSKFGSDKAHKYVYRTQHKNIELMEERKGKIIVLQLLNVLWVDDALNQRYHLIGKNCKHFAAVVIDFISGQVKIPVDTGLALLDKHVKTVRELEVQTTSIHKKGKIAAIVGTSATILATAVGVPAAVVGTVATGGLLLPVALAGAGICGAVATAGGVTSVGAAIGTYMHTKTKNDEATTAIKANNEKSQQFLDGVDIDET